MPPDPPPGLTLHPAPVTPVSTPLDVPSSFHVAVEFREQSVAPSYVITTLCAPAESAVVPERASPLHTVKSSTSFVVWALTTPSMLFPLRPLPFHVTWSGIPSMFAS